MLESNYDALCASFPIFACCSKRTFIDCLTGVSASWLDRRRDRLSPAQAADGVHAHHHQGTRCWPPVPEDINSSDVDMMPCSSFEHFDFTDSDTLDKPLVKASAKTTAESDTDRPSLAGAGVRTNAGECVDAALHERWEGIAADPCALERFGRSVSM